MKAPTRQFRFTIPTFLCFFPTCLCLSPNLRAIAVPVTCRAIGARTRLGAYAVTVRFIAVAFLASFWKTKLRIPPMSLQLFLVAAVIAANIALDDLNLRLRPRFRPCCLASFGSFSSFRGYDTENDFISHKTTRVLALVASHTGAVSLLKGLVEPRILCKSAYKCLNYKPPKF